MKPVPDQKYMSTRKILGLPESDEPVPFPLRVVEKLVGIEQVNKLMAEIGPPWPDTNSMVEFLFERLDIKWEIENPEMLDKLDDRPKVFVANHPYGLPDAFALFQMLTKYRPNIKLFANKLLEAATIDDERLLYVDPFMAAGERGANRRSVAVAIKHLREGGDLALFPGRICSHLKTSDWMISDSEWTDQIKRFVQVSGGELVPMFISGRNSMLFNLSGLIHPRIRTYMLLREFLKGGHDFRFNIGEPVSAEHLEKISKTVSPGLYSRSLTYALKTGSPEVPNIPQLIEPGHISEMEMKRLSRIPVDTSGAEVKRQLEKHPVLIQHNGFTIYQAGKDTSQLLLDVICETRFCAYISETNMTDPSQLQDKYDNVYDHLILWDDDAEKVAGVYRFTLPNLKQYLAAPDNLVTSSIFDLKPEFTRILDNSMELGRAAILPEYQKSYSPLMVLWRGILEIPRQNKSIKYLFGPVTMGRTFNPVSHELLRRFIMSYCGDEQMKEFVTPRRQLDLQIPREVNMSELENACRSFAELGNIVNGFEGGKRNLPVLFRHYANIGCRYVGFGEWKELDYATAGLTVLELKNISQSLIQRYYGAEGANAFLAGR